MPTLRRRVEAAWRRLGSVDALLDEWTQARLLEVESLRIELCYSFRDVALTGQFLAALSMLSGVLPGRFCIDQTPVWELEDRLRVDADARVRVWPLRLLTAAVRFVLRERRRARQYALPRAGGLGR